MQYVAKFNVLALLFYFMHLHLILGIYRSYFGSDLDYYVFTFDCLSGKPAFTCPFADTFVSLYVKRFVHV